MKKSYKLNTGIDGLDKLFFGGIHIETDEDLHNSTSEEGKKSNNDGRNNPIIAIRGNRGVNKVYLELPICRGLCEALRKETNKEEKTIIFSLSKTKERLESIYCNIFIQDIIHKIQTESERKSLDIYKKSLSICESADTNESKHKSFHKVISSKLNLNTPKSEEEICKAIRIGLIYFNERTRYFHIRRPQRNNDNDRTKLLCIDASHLAEKHNVTFMGREDLLKDGEGTNNLVMFHELLQKLKADNMYACIVVDGLSRLTDKDMEQCPFDALVDILHKKSHIGILSMDERLPVPKINPEIIIDMRMRLDDKNNFTCREVCISKCLHQQNAYGWHTYKIRNFGIEIIPSIHKILYRRNYMDNAIPEALLSISKPSYRYWLEESIENHNIKDIERSENKNPKKEAKNVENLLKNYTELYSPEQNNDLYDKIRQGSITAVFNGKEPEDRIIEYILSNIYSQENNEKHHVLFIDFNRSKKDFWTLIKGDMFEKYHNLYDNIHFFRIRYGCISPDELLYTIEQQVDALTKKIIDNNEETSEEDKCLYKQYKYIHVVMGDLKYLEFGYPCLCNDGLFLPAFVDLTKGNYMENYIYMSEGSEILKKKILLAVDNNYELPHKGTSRQ